MQTSNITISVSNTKQRALVPDNEYELNNNDLIIYTIYYPNFIDLKSNLIHFLNEDEVQRAERFHQKLDTDRFIIYRSILKFILAAYTKQNVKEIILDYDFNKKPYLASHPELHFNISHSENYAVIAISTQKVGIDIEYISEEFCFDAILPDIFEYKEISAIQNAVNKKEAFYTLWTRKEAFVKALGKGIDEDFKDIPCLEGQHCIDSRLINNTANWQVCTFDINDCYIGAVAFEGVSKLSKNLMIYSLPHTFEALIQIIEK